MQQMISFGKDLDPVGFSYFTLFCALSSFIFPLDATSSLFKSSGKEQLVAGRGAFRNVEYGVEDKKLVQRFFLFSD